MYDEAKQAREPSLAEQEKVQSTLGEFGQYRAYRDAGFASHWDEIAQLILPTSANTFYYGSDNTPGEKKTHQQVDASGMMALQRFAAICDSLLTPRNMKWHMLGAEADYLMKDRKTKLWYEATTNALFRYRYAPEANFSGQNQNVFQSIGAFGNASMFIDALAGGSGLRYLAVPLGETYFGENHQGIIDRFIRVFRYTARQAEQHWPNQLPACMWKALRDGSQNRFTFLHCVKPRSDDYDPERLDARGKKFSSYYVSIEGKCLMGEEGGYNTFPMPASRYMQTPNEVYGRGPAMMVLPALKTLNAQKRTFLKQGHRASDPILLTADDGLVDFNMTPGAMNPGGWSADGKPLVGTLPTGSIQTNEKMMDMERGLIEDVFLVSLFKMIFDENIQTAAQFMEIVSQKGILLAPTVGRQQSEYLGPMIDRELDVLSQQRLLLPMPPLLQEARGEYSVIYTSPLSRQMRAQEAAGFFRTIEHVKEVVAITQDPSLLDTFDFDVSTPAIAEINAVPTEWMASSEKISAKREARANVQAKQMQIQAAPAAAAMMKAQAATEG